MTLDEAKQLIRGGAHFGDCFERLDPEGRALIPGWFVREPGLPNLAARAPAAVAHPVATPELTRRQAAEAGYTGDPCPVCGSARMKRNGSCLMCESCGSTTGCS